MGVSNDSVLVLTIIGEDRPGIVESVSGVVLEHGGNWEEARMMRLANRFAGMLLVSVPKDRAPALSRALEALSQKGLRVLSDLAAETAAPSRTDLRLQLVGNDRTGIVREIAHALTALGVNFEDLSTETEDAPMAGSLLFRASARLSVPPGVSAGDVRRALERIAVDLMVDLSIEE